MNGWLSMKKWDEARAGVVSLLKPGREEREDIGTMGRNRKLAPWVRTASWLVIDARDWARSG